MEVVPSGTVIAVAGYPNSLLQPVAEIVGAQPCTVVRQPLPIVHVGKLGVGPDSTYAAVSAMTTEVNPSQPLNAVASIKVTDERSSVFRDVQPPNAKPSMAFTEDGILIEDNLRELSKAWCRITVNVDGRVIDSNIWHELKA